MKNKKLKLGIAVSILIVMIAIVIVVITKPIIKLNNNKFNKAITAVKNDKIVLDDVVPFEWDVVYSFAPYTSKNKIEETIGIKSRIIQETVNDDMVQLIFVKNDKIVSYICGQSSKLGYSIYFDEPIKNNDKVELKVNKNSDIIEFTKK